jgi:hypothetical protein
MKTKNRATRLNEQTKEKLNRNDGHKPARQRIHRRKAL